jgi:hypothetical protein
LLIKIVIIAFSFVASVLHATEYKLRGVVDLRITSANTLDSYTDGGYGKFSSNDGQNIALAQAGLEFIAQWDSGISAHLVGNAYLDDNDSTLGITEAFLKYRGLPNSAGYRWQNKTGIFYPEISLENNVIAWASKDTLNSSAINSWIGEEIRVLGSELSVTRLGRIYKQAFDVSFAATAFINNDPAGSLLSWHGWTVGNKQTLWNESKAIPDFKARMPGYDLVGQAAKSDPFIELDDKVGFHLKTQIKFHNKGELLLGYYDNNGTPYIVENGQYAWRTRFAHAGVRWKLPNAFELTAQYLTGDTLMQSEERKDIVNNDYSSGFITISKRIQKHRMTVRLEEFSVTDNDNTLGDNNNEYGKSATFNYTFRYNKPWFLSVEYNWINSDRPSRSYVNQAVNLTERQIQLAARYYY